MDVVLEIRIQINSNLIFQKIKKNLDKFNAISVRDQNSFDLVRNLLNSKTNIVLDPYLSDPEFYNQTNQHIKKNSKKNFILIYGIILTKKKFKIFKFCQKQNLEIFSASYINRWANKILLM